MGLPWPPFEEPAAEPNGAEDGAESQAAEKDVESVASSHGEDGVDDEDSSPETPLTSEQEGDLESLGAEEPEDDCRTLQISPAEMRDEGRDG